MRNRPNLELFYGPNLVGMIEGALWSDGTGYGIFRPSGADEPATRRVREYIDFSEDWHVRLRSGQPHNKTEFDAFRDIHESELWRAVGEDGKAEPIFGPVFVDGEVTWGPAPAG
jgi:hypothetical protein